MKQVFCLLWESCATHSHGGSVPWVLSTGGSQQQFQAGTDFAGFPKVSALAQISAWDNRGQTQETHTFNKKAKAAAEPWDSAGLAWWRLLRSVGNGSMILVSTTDVTCPGHKESSIPIKMEKLILKGKGRGTERCRNKWVQTKFYEESWSALSL